MARQRTHRNRSGLLSGHARVPKTDKIKKSRRYQCGCVSAAGVPKVWFAERWDASRRAGDTMEAGKMWNVYRCPERNRVGYHIASVRNDPWKNSQSESESDT